MDLKDLKTLDSFDGESVTRCDRFLVEDSLSHMRHFGNRIVEAYDYVIKNGETSLTSQFVFDSIKGNLNDYVQAFLDVAAVLYANSEKSRGEKLTSIRQAIRFYTSSYTNYSDDCGRWIEFLQRRNELIHEYYNYEFMTDELKTALLNYSDCVQELVDSLYENAKEQGLLSFVIRKGRT